MSQMSRDAIRSCGNPHHSHEVRTQLAPLCMRESDLPRLSDSFPANEKQREDSTPFLPDSKLSGIPWRDSAVSGSQVLVARSQPAFSLWWLSLKWHYGGVVRDPEFSLRLLTCSGSYLVRCLTSKGIFRGQK